MIYSPFNFFKLHPKCTISESALCAVLYASLDMPNCQFIRIPPQITQVKPGRHGFVTRQNLGYVKTNQLDMVVRSLPLQIDSRYFSLPLN